MGSELLPSPHVAAAAHGAKNKRKWHQVHSHANECLHSNRVLSVWHTGMELALLRQIDHNDKHRNGQSDAILGAYQAMDCKMQRVTRMRAKRKCRVGTSLDLGLPCRRSRADPSAHSHAAAH